jgi:hypothetical protein
MQVTQCYKLGSKARHGWGRTARELVTQCYKVGPAR